MSADSPLPQLTVKAILLGVILAMVLAGANAYLGLFAGLTVSASIPAAVISMGLLKLFRESNILENNIVQTAASAGESVAAGVIFTLPALVLLGYWTEFDYFWVSIIAGLGGLLGVLFTIPLRRSLIVERQLAYPEGQATAEVLRAGDSGGGLKLLAGAGLAGGLTKFAESGLRLWPGSAEAATNVGSSVAYVGSNLSPALLSVGYIVRLNIASLVFFGGILAWWLLIPLYLTFAGSSDPDVTALREAGASAAAVAGDVWNRKIRYVGVGAMLVGGIWALISMRSSLVDGIRGGLQQVRASNAGAPVLDHTDQDTPMTWALTGIVLFVIPIFFLYQTITGSFVVSLPLAIVMVIAGFLFSSVAAYMAGLVGSSNNPISGITIATVTFTSFLLLFLVGADSPIGPPAAILVGAVVCCAAAIAGDNLQDLKAGYILGATPWKQQLMQGIGTISAALVMAPVLTLLLKAYGFGPATAENPDALQAPQATLMASVAEGVFGGNLPWLMIGIGAAVAVIVIWVDLYREKRGGWRAPVLAVAVGIYLPLELSVPIYLGGLISYFSERAAGGGEDSNARRNGILIAAGLITGEALIGIGMAIPIVMTGDRNVLSLGVEGLGSWPGIAVMIALSIWLYRIASRRDEQTS